MSVLITIGVLALFAMLGVGVYNRLIALRNQVTNGWKQFDVELKRRHDLISHVVNTLEGAMEFEPETLEAVRAARNRAATAVGPADAGQKEGELSATLGRLFALAARYPQLTASENVRALQEELSATESKAGLALQFYNDIATKYNAATQAVPGNIIAGFAGFKSAELFETTDAAGRNGSDIDLSMKKS